MATTPTQGSDLYNYVAKISADVQSGVISQSDANKMIQTAYSVASPTGDFRGNDWQKVRYGHLKTTPTGPTSPTPTGPSGPTGTTAPTAPNGGQYNPVVTDAVGYLEGLIYTAVGVAGLGQWAASLYQNGASPLEIVQALRYGTDTSEAGKAAYQKYLAAFPGMDEFLKQGIFTGENPESQYINYRNSVLETMQRYGASENLASKENVKNYLLNRISAAEIAERASMAASAVATTPTETLRLLNEYYGVGSSDLMTFFLDTDQTEAELQKRYTAARIGTEGLRQQFGVSAAEAESLVERGISVGEAASGFQQASRQQAFMSGPGETATRSDILQGTFGQEEAAQKLQRIAGSRTGRFQEGGGYAGGQQGVSGLGTSTTR